jgi:Uma2 family endonuclease
MATESPLTFISERTLSQEEFAAWVAKRPPGDDSKCELLGGRVIMTPPSGWPEGEGEGDTFFVIKQIVRARNLGRVFGPSQGFELPTGDTVAPDAAFVSHERWNAAPVPVPGRFLRVVPDLLVEVTTPGGSARDRVDKRLAYAASGVREYWIVDLRLREVTVHHQVAEGRFDAGKVLREKDTFGSVVLGADVSVCELLASTS